jgi:hypothetical protein
MNAMKLAIAAAVLTSSFSAFAKGEKASNAEQTLLCQAVSQLGEITYADMALDEASCQSNENVVSKLVTEGVRVVSGKLKFRAPSRPEFELTCTVAYYAQPTLENVVEGIEAGVNCGSQSQD